MIPLIPIVGPWLVKKLLAGKPGRTDQRAEFLAKVIQIVAVVALLVVAWQVFDHFNDKAAVAEASADAVNAAREADAEARTTVDSSINSVESSNDEARRAAEGSDDPLADGLRSLR